MTKPTKWLCAQQRLRSAWASVQSDQSSLSAWRKLGPLATHWAHSEDSDQTEWMPWLIWVFAGHTCHFVGFVMRRLIYYMQFITSGIKNERSVTWHPSDEFSHWSVMSASVQVQGVVSQGFLPVVGFYYCTGCIPTTWITLYEPHRDKTNKMAGASSEDSDSLGIHPVWSVSSLCA